jgi:hypothetical protein
MRYLSLVLVAALALIVSSASAASRPPKVLTQENPTFQVRPATISYTGDGTGIVGGDDGRSARKPGHLKWTAYNRKVGRAIGVVWLDDCTPSCAQGRFSPSPVRVQVSEPTHGHFRLLTLRYRYHGRRYVDRRVTQYYREGPGEAGFWAYAICGIQYGPNC